MPHLLLVHIFIDPNAIRVNQEWVDVRGRISSCYTKRPSFISSTRIQISFPSQRGKTSVRLHTYAYEKRESVTFVVCQWRGFRFLTDFSFFPDQLIYDLVIHWILYLLPWPNRIFCIVNNNHAWSPKGDLAPDAFPFPVVRCLSQPQSADLTSSLPLQE